MTVAIKWVLLVTSVLAVVAIGLVTYGSSRWAEGTDALLAQLEAARVPAAKALYEARELEGLPAPVARYFRAALRPGQPMVRRARMSWSGEFNMGEPGKDKWVPFTAEQLFVPGAPGFVWNARMVMAPGIPVLVRDAYAGGAGSMHGAIFGLIDVVNAEGTPAIAAGALQRYLGEAAWFPTALLPSQGVTWTPIDDSRALATIVAGGIRVSLEFRFRPDGLIDSCYAPDRVFDDGKSPPTPRPWTARNLRFEERNGMMVAAEAVAEWQFPSGLYQYWRGKSESIQLDYVAN